MRGHRDSRSLSLIDASLSLSLSLSLFRCRKLGIARWPHRKLHSLLEMFKSLAGYYKVGKDTSFAFGGRLTFFLSNNKREFLSLRGVTTLYYESKKYSPLTNDENEPLTTQELCEKATLEPCPQRQSKHMEEVHIVRKDLVHLRNYALKVVRSCGCFWCSFFWWC